ncbi:hypothetical protein NDU88_006783 [Pleurodeles waltl]|uniref:Uncharacterized protein n=1 Tax=Pleurodeles waltl TaxID=8319 RepID=A0AAV7N0F5_PLEWA|nr:hypothetical protein NDU88_006783 [Pleurodeles waltl]
MRNPNAHQSKRNHTFRRLPKVCQSEEASQFREVTVGSRRLMVVPRRWYRQVDRKKERKDAKYQSDVLAFPNPVPKRRQLKVWLLQIPFV